MMSSPSMEAFTAGYFFSAATAALTKKDMKPSLTPFLATKASWYFLRSAITARMFTSLKVVSMAALCCASSRRSAMRLRRRVIGTRSSRRRLPPARYCLTSFLVTLPPRPLPATSPAATPASAAILRAAGLRALSSALAAAAAGAAAFSAAGAAAAGASATAPSSM